MSHLTIKKTEIIFCHECGTLALAKLNDTPYCTQCLFRHVMQLSEPIHANLVSLCIQPLDFPSNLGLTERQDSASPQETSLQFS